MNSILQVRDSATGEWINIPALVGPKGEPGNSGVYVGPGEIPEGYNIQIDPTSKAPVLVQSVNGVKPDENGNVEVQTAPDSEYTLPIATPDTLGGVKPVAKTEDMTQPVGVDELGGLWSVSGGKTTIETLWTGLSLGEIALSKSTQDYEYVFVTLQYTDGKPGVVDVVYQPSTLIPAGSDCWVLLPVCLFNGAPILPILRVYRNQRFKIIADNCPYQMSKIVGVKFNA